MFKVYFIDDEQPIIDELCSIIDWGAYDFAVCGYNTDPVEACSEILEKKPDLVISDIRMDEILGLELIERIKARNKNVKFCILSAYDEFEYAKQALKLRVISFLTKPVKVSELAEVLEEVKHENYSDWIGFLVENLDKEDLPSVRQKLREGVGDRFRFLPPCSDVRIAMTAGSLPPGFFHCDLCITLSDDAKIAIYLLYGLKGTDSAQRSVGISEKIDDYGLFLKAADSARVCLRESFITGAPTVFYMPGDSRAEEASVIGQIKGCDTKTKLYEWIRNLPARKDVHAYNLQRIYKQIILQGLRLDSDLFDIEMTESPVFETYDNLKELSEALLGAFAQQRKTSSVSGVIKEIMQDIENHLSERHTLSMYAKKFSFNMSYLSQLYKKETGMSFMDFLMEKRLGKAEELIAYTDKTMREISEEVGFDDYFHFSKIFKKYKGVSPAEYREKHGKNR